MRRGLERRELSLELGDARGQRVALGLERLAVARAHRRPAAEASRRSRPRRTRRPARSSR